MMLTTATSTVLVTTSREVRRTQWPASRLVLEQPPSRQSAGLMTYPAPRIVWIIGVRPASIFLRR